MSSAGKMQESWPISERIRVLHVDDDADFGEIAADYLERNRDRLDVEAVWSVDDALDRLERADCVVSDYRMAGLTGLEFLDAAREQHPDLPFILFTGHGSEEIASEAISRGATDYLRKRRGEDQYAVLANRIEEAVEKTRAQRDRRRQLKAIESAQEGVAFLDRDGRFTYVNDTYADLYSYERSDLVGEHWSLVYPDDEVAFVREELLPSLREEDGSWHGRTTGLRADGTTFPEDHVVSRTDAGELVCTVRDVSDREARQQALDRCETIIEALGDPVYALNAEGRFTYVNDALVDVMGYERETLLGQHVSEVMPEEDVAEGATLIEDLLADDERRTATYEMEVVRADGTTLAVENHLAVLPFEDCFAGSAGVLRDISERKERERQLRRTNERLDEFAKVVSHDLRNPLSAAQAHLQVAREETDSDRLDAVARSHDRMATLVDDLLSYARDGRTVGDLEPVALRTVAERCRETVPSEGLDLRVEDDLTVYADESRLQQLVENLVRNSVEHASAAGGWRASSDGVADDSDGRNGQWDAGVTDGGATLDDGDTVAVRIGPLDDGFYVADDGPGIPEADRERVFDAGYTTSEDGSGFGLSIVEDVVEGHGWSVAVTESEGGGARFAVTGVDTWD